MALRYLLLVVFAVNLVSGCGNSGTDTHVTANPSQAFLAPASPSLVLTSMSETVSVLSTETDTVTHTFQLPPGENSPTSAFVVYSSVSEQLYVGDSANSRVLVFGASDLKAIDSLATQSDAFHMGTNGGQLWVVDRKAFVAIVFDVRTRQRLATVALPNDLRLTGGVPHDVVLDDTHAYVTVFGLPGQRDAVLKYDRTTFMEVGRVTVGAAPHLAISTTKPELYVACEESHNVFVIDRNTFLVQAELPVPGVHRLWASPDGRSLVITTSESDTGLIIIDLATHQELARGVSPIPEPLSVVGTPDGSKVYVIHSTAISVFTIDSPGLLPQADEPRFQTRMVSHVTAADGGFDTTVSP